MKRYNPKELEPAIQAQWAKSDIYSAVDYDKKPKYVMLTEFPYPSGDGLHMGHVREYTLGDIIARRQRMAGHNVLYPMGYDSFGLPTENYAIKKKISPQKATEDNIKYFQEQFNALGYSIDWDRSFTTTDPGYYKWTQWIFLQFFKKGLAYQDETAINWCPKCKTGLANEEVINGLHERCETEVEKKLLKQWLLKITDYAEKLIDGLATVDYPSKIADQQINWIGKSVGAEVDFKVDSQNKIIKVFTTRPDTLFGATFMVLAPEHPLVRSITSADKKADVEEYIKQTEAKTDIDRMETSREKTGVFTGSYAINPVNDEKIPIWIADYVLMGYGTGAIMAVPAHDERDYEFAQKFNLKIIEVIKPADKFEGCYCGEGEVINSCDYSGLSSQEMREKIVDDLAIKNLANEKTQYKLRDWIFSRQHYWGEPIPIIHCDKCGAVPVPEDQLPVTLPKVDHYEPTDTGESPLAAITEWVYTSCPVCGGPAKRETDTMPNWAGSSWYYLRYYDAKNDKEFASQDKLKYWGEVDLYLGGMEHTTLHLLYSRFWHQFLFDQKLVPTPEPYKCRRGQGIILAPDGQKMSKSKGNVINPLDIIEQGYGADALRLAITFLAPYDQTTPWNPEVVAGTLRFLQRVWVITQRYIETDIMTDNVELEGELLTASHKAIKKVSKDLETMNFNTAISALMEFTNELYKIEAKDGFASVKAWDFTIKTLLQLLAPFAPHITEELWQQIGQKESIHLSQWPVHNEAYLVKHVITIAIQVNGKLRGDIEMPHDADQKAIEESAKQHENVAQHLTGDIKKVIYVPGKLINFVV
jgi:leucyl-tRNA synthetase